MICATTACTATPLLASNTRLTESGVTLSDCEYADCENLRTIGTVWDSKVFFAVVVALILGIANNLM